MNLRQRDALLASEDALMPLLKRLRGELGLILYFYAIPSDNERDYRDCLRLGEPTNGESQTIYFATM